MKVINIITDKNSSKWAKLLDAQLKLELEQSHDALANNYYNLLVNLNKYRALHCLFDNERIVALAAIQSKGFPVKCCRLLSRAFIFSKYRELNKNTIRRKHSYLTQFLLPAQIECAIKLGFTEGFVSMQYLRRYHFLKRWTEMLNSSKVYGHWNFINDRMFLTCQSPADKSCWQLITTTNFTNCKTKNNITKLLTSMNIEDYKRKF